MKILSIEHADFNLIADYETSGARDLPIHQKYEQASKKYADKSFTTRYLLSEKVKHFSIWAPGEPVLKQIESKEAKHPVFFESSRYKILIEFVGDDVFHPFLYSRTKYISDKFEFTKNSSGRYVASNVIDFDDTAGFFDVQLNYMKGTVDRTFVFRLEVFTCKLDMKRDFPLMVKEVEYNYTRLVLDYLQLTHHDFDIVATEQLDDLVWWIIFNNIYKRLLNHLKFIVEHPHSTIKQVKVFRKADKIKRANARLEEKIYQYRGEPGKFFVLPAGQLMTDTYENKTVKFILQDIISKQQRICNTIRKSGIINRMSSEYRTQLDYVTKTLQHLVKHSFFKDIGAFKGFTHSSNVFQHKTGYAALLRDWEELKKNYALFERGYELEFKNIGYLYQFWCFLSVLSILKKLLGEPSEIIKIPDVKQDWSGFAPAKDMNSKIVFHTPAGDIIELYNELDYNKAFAGYSEDQFTEEIRPDIVLRIRKNDQPDNCYFTYIFDAKYQVKEAKDMDQMDLPLQANIDRMRTYRDLIYDREIGKNNQTELIREALGAYVLYPGKGSAAQFKAYYQEVKDKKIGGFPLKPGDDLYESFLKQHLQMIIERSSKELLQNESLQNDNKYMNDDAYVLIVLVEQSHPEQIDYLLNNEATIFHHKYLPMPVVEGTVRYFAPYIAGQGITCYYKITGYKWKPMREVYPPDHILHTDSPKKCLALYLDDKRELNISSMPHGGITHKKYTTIGSLKEPDEGFIKTFTERDISPLGNS